MRFLLLAFALATSLYGFQAQEPAKPPAPAPLASPSAPASPASQAPQAAAQAPAAPQPTGDAGYLDPAQLKALLHKIWLIEYRTNDLLTDVHPEKWKIPDDVRHSFNEALDNLRGALTSQEDWRAQFEKRPDSLYLGFQTFVSMTAVQPRLDAVARGVSQYENRSLGAQYSQAENQLFDLQQALQPALEYLLRNQDQLMVAAQTNLASCQNELGFAMQKRAGPAKPMKNVFTEYRVPRHSSGAGDRRSGKSDHQAAKPGEKKGGEKPKPKPSEAVKTKASAVATKPAQKK